MAAALLWSTATLSASAQEPDFKDRLPRIAPLEPVAAMKTFSVEPGFRVELFAAEPLVTDPVAMAFDADGRLFVVEMRDYSEDDKAELGQIRLLEDTNGDGRAERSTIFADGLSWPTAVACLHGGIVVAAAPDVFFFRDTDGDGEADEKVKLYTGFSRSNVQGLVNSLRWGLDNRLHGATSTAGGELIRVGSIPDVWPEPVAGKEKAVRLSGRDFSIHPLTGEVRAESGGGQHGMCFDDWGHKFVSSNSDHIQQVMFEDRYIARNPYLAAPSPRISIAADGPAAPVFRTSPVEPWRIVRTELRVSGKVPGVVEGGGKPAGYFTGATGVYVYRGDAFPAAFRGSAFIGDVGSNLIHRKVLEPKEPGSVELRAKRVDEGREFLASSDIWFRPCQFGDGPDGVLYVCDVYREVIEHPASLPPMIKQHLDLTSGRDRGRIYRVVPEGFKQPRGKKLSEAKTEELVALLAHPNGWQRDTAARLLYERQDKQAAPALEKLATEAESPLGRMHALYALAGLGQAKPETVAARLKDADPRVRVHVLRVAESVDVSGMTRTLASLDHDHAEVRLQLAWTLGSLPAEAGVGTLARLAEHPRADRWLWLAVLSSAERRQAPLLTALLKKRFGRPPAAARSIEGQLAEQIGLAQRIDHLESALEALTHTEDQALTRDLFRSLCEGAGRSGAFQKLAADPIAKPFLTELLAHAEKAAGNAQLKDADRAAAVRTLGFAAPDEALKQLTPLLDGRQPQAVQQAAIETLSRLPGQGPGQAIVAAWSNFSPQVRVAAVEALFARTERLPTLLDALASKAIPLAELDPARVQLLAKHRDADISRRAGELLAKAKLGTRADVVAAHRDVLTLPGDVERGKAVFKKTCAACHKLEGVGFETGPNLATMQNRGAEAILLNVLDPNKEVNPQYVNYVALTVDGRSVTGMLAAETAASVTLRRAEGQSDTLLRANLEELKSTGLSIMPVGLEQTLTKQNLADVIAYLLSIR